MQLLSRRLVRNGAARCLVAMGILVFSSGLGVTAEPGKYLNAPGATIRSSDPQMRILAWGCGALILLLGVAGTALLIRETRTRSRIENGLRVAKDLLGPAPEWQARPRVDIVAELQEQIYLRQSREDQLWDRCEDLERQVAESARELKRVNEEAESFRYSISHELRAPLRHVEGFAQILMQDHGPQLPYEAQQNLRRVLEGAARLGAMLEDLLELFRIGNQSLQPKRCSLQVLAEEARADAEKEGQGREIDWHIYSLPEVMGDPELLRMALFQLFSNAVKFTRDCRTPVIEAGSLTDGEWNVIFVRDNGTGFDSRYGDKLFGAFQRLHRDADYEGKGIGLALVRRLIHRHGGEVWAEAKPGCGAIFYIRLPVVSSGARGKGKSIGTVA